MKNKSKQLTFGLLFTSLIISLVWMQAMRVNEHRADAMREKLARVDIILREAGGSYHLINSPFSMRHEPGTAHGCRFLSMRTYEIIIAPKNKQALLDKISNMKLSRTKPKEDKPYISVHARYEGHKLIVTTSDGPREDIFTFLDFRCRAKKTKPAPLEN